MSEREKAIEMLNNIPDSKISFVITYLQGLSDGSEEVPDEWDQEMIREARQINDGERIDIKDLAEEFGVIL